MYHLSMIKNLGFRYGSTRGCQSLLVRAWPPSRPFSASRKSETSSYSCVLYDGPPPLMLPRDCCCLQIYLCLVPFHFSAGLQARLCHSGFDDGVPGLQTWPHSRPPFTAPRVKSGGGASKRIRFLSLSCQPLRPFLQNLRRRRTRKPQSEVSKLQQQKASK